MKKLVKVLLALLPFLAVSAMAAPAQKSPIKQSVKQTKNTSVKKQAEKKLVVKTTSTKKVVDKKSVKAKKTKKSVENKKTVQKKSVAKADQKMLKKQRSTDKKSTKLATKSASRKELNNAPKTTLAKAKNMDKKGEKTENNAAKALPLSQAKKMVVVPKCQDDNVVKVLSDAFKQQGKATGVPMTVKQLSQTRETQHYPQQGIRSCHALVETSGKKYQTDYSVILNGNGFFVQVENAQAIF
ncbi:hypothetical protein [Rodentibacter myodis]|uniref:Histone H1 n=1 Tax=Rodentibacter myodis TaxID=1907939 RepID=A0A1V3JL97_9PAST|nr:hypothetical protein [Rodentibacter myodis]OOF57551.1 hypothetical protein BKL49_08685 [Rodentibacter myodis]